MLSKYLPMKIGKSILGILLLTLLHEIGLAQQNLSLKFFGLSLHPKGDPNAALMPRKLDPKGHLVLNLGLVGGYENYIWKDRISVKILQSLYSDCAARLGGFSHVGLRAVVFHQGNHSISTGFGPTLVYRKNWYGLEGYENPEFFKGKPGNQWQYRFMWYGGEIEYNYTITDRFDLSVMFIPGYPKLMSLSLGTRYWITH